MDHISAFPKYVEFKIFTETIILGIDLLLLASGLFAVGKLAMCLYRVDEVKNCY